MADTPDLVKLRMGQVCLATEAAFDEVKADMAYTWLEAAEEAEKNLSNPGAGFGSISPTQ